MEISLRAFQKDLILSVLSVTLSKFILAHSDIVLDHIRNRMNRRSRFNNLVESFPISGSDEFIDGLDGTIQSSSIAFIIEVYIDKQNSYIEGVRRTHHYLHLMIVKLHQFFNAIRFHFFNKQIHFAKGHP
jgi:hypothetical protein